MAVTDSVFAKRAALSANMPPPQPTSRYRRLWFGGGSRCDERQLRMNVCRCGFIRWRTREEPCGSHHVEARALKCDISEALTEGDSEWCGGGVEEAVWVVVVLWYRQTRDGVVTDGGCMLRRKWRAAAVVLRGINAFIGVTNMAAVSLVGDDGCRRS